MENSKVIRINEEIVENLEKFRGQLKEDDKKFIVSLGDDWYDKLSYVQLIGMMTDSFINLQKTLNK